MSNPTSNERLTLLERFVERVACYDDYTHDDVDEALILRDLQNEAKKLWSPDRLTVETPAPQVFMYCPGAGLLRCEHRDCIDNGCHLVRDGSCAHRALNADTLVKARELNAELRRAVKTSAEDPPSALDVPK